MAMSVVYATINGQIVSENRGGVISYYVPDNLGSTVALLDATGTVTDTFTYWPYGEIQSHVGSSLTPFTFCGTLGYYLDVVGSQMYVRARYLRQALTRWLTKDPVSFFLAGLYLYSKSSPIVWSDAAGLDPKIPDTCKPNVSIISILVGAFCSALKSKAYSDCVANCADSAWGTKNGQDYASCASKWCKSGSVQCPASCPPGVCATAPLKGGPSCDVAICSAMFTNSGCFNSKNWNSFIGILSHELGHCCTNAPTNDTDPNPNNWPPGALCNYAMGNCIGSNCNALLLIAAKNALLSTPMAALA